MRCCLDVDTPELGTREALSLDWRAGLQPYDAPGTHRNLARTTDAHHRLAKTALFKRHFAKTTARLDRRGLYRELFRDGGWQARSLR